MLLSPSHANSGQPSSVGSWQDICTVPIWPIHWTVSQEEYEVFSLQINCYIFTMDPSKWQWCRGKCSMARKSALAAGLQQANVFTSLLISRAENSRQRINPLCCWNFSETEIFWSKFQAFCSSLNPSAALSTTKWSLWDATPYRKM